jgi:RNA polymerase sigma-70 factor (ECF subfamily)
LYKYDTDSKDVPLKSHDFSREFAHPAVVLMSQPSGHFQPHGEFMGISPPGRALPFPLVWGKSKPSSSQSQTLVEESHAQVGPASRAPAAEIADEILLRRVAKGDAEALGQLIDRYSRLVMRIAVRILHDYAEAEEIMQEVFLYIYRKAGLFDSSRGSGKGWVLQLAYHRALDRWTYLNRRGFYLGTDAAAMADTLLGDTDLEREIGSRLNRAQLAKAFEELPEQQRRTLELFYFDGLELREISERLGEPLGNIRHHYYRGLKKLQKSAIVQKLRDRKKDV